MSWLNDLYDWGSKLVNNVLDPSNLTDMVNSTLNAPTSLDWKNYEELVKNNERNYQNQLATFGLQKEAFGLQKSQMNWQRESQERTWAREDTAVQRRMADLRAAGMNPLLAAGSAAQTSSPVSPAMPNAPSLSPSKQTAMRPSKAPDLGVMMQMLMTQKQIDQSESQAKLNVAQANRQQAEADFISASSPSRIQTLDYEAIVAKETASYRIEKLRQDIEAVGLDNARRWIDNQIKDVNLDQERIRKVTMQVQQKAEQLGLTRAEQEIISKAILIEVQNTENKQKAHDYTFWEGIGLPSNGGLDPASRLLGGTRFDSMRRYRDAW